MSDTQLKATMTHAYEATTYVVFNSVAQTTHVIYKQLGKNKIPRKWK